MTVFNKYLAIILAATLAYACTKGSDDPINAGPTGRLNLINAITDVKAINVYLNGTRQNNNSTIFLNGVSGYITVPVAQQQYQIKEDTLRLQLVNIPLALPAADKSYSVLVTGQKNAGNITSILMDDSYTDTLNNTARVRFVQGTAGTTNYDVYVNDTLRFSNQAFKAVANFVNIGPGAKTVRIRPTGTTTNAATITTTLAAGNYYTIFTTGTATGTGTNALNAITLLTK